MILNSKHNQFVFYFPPNFWYDGVKEQYNDFYKSLLLPYDNVDDYVLSTLQSVSFPGWSISPTRQTGYRGSERDYKAAAPVKDVIEKKFSLTFKMTEGFMNYALFQNNAIHYLDHENTIQYFDNMILGLLNNEGFLMETITFKKVIMKGMSSFNLDYSSVDSTFNKFNVDFLYNDWDINSMYDQMINLYEGS